MAGKDIEMTLYDLNKAMYLQMKPMEAYDFTQQMVNIALWFSSKKDAKYFMLLCKERSDYTVFDFQSYDYDTARNELTAIITNRGMPMDVDYDHDTDTYDIWVKKGGEVYMYKLFDCDDFVIRI